MLLLFAETLPESLAIKVIQWLSPCPHAHMGADFFPEGGKNASKIVVPPKMALGEGILFTLLGEG